MERRKDNRIRVRWPVAVLTDSGVIQAETRNITANGIFICCGDRLRLNKIFPLRISPPNKQALEVKGRVIWSDRYAVDGRDTYYGMGICFVKISDGDRHSLADLIAAHPE